MIFGRVEETIATDWYRTAFAGTADMAWTDGTESEVSRALQMLRPRGGERVLDLACGWGRHALELSRRGFEVVGVDISSDLLEIAAGEAEMRQLDVELLEADLRELSFEAEFDIVLSLNDGAIGYFESEEENRRTFEVISRALRPGGRHLAQLPNVLYAERNLPPRSWVVGSSMVELHEQRWNDRERRLEGAKIPARYDEPFRLDRGIRFSQRLYTVDELRRMLAAVGMALDATFGSDGHRSRPEATQPELFVASTKA